jgi:hypothetical protein
LAALGLAVLTASFAAPASAAAPGVSVDLTWGVSRADIDREVDLLVRSGVPWVRMSMAWNGIERFGPGQYDTRFLGDMDYAVQRVRAAGIDVVMPISDGVPYWASADPAKHVDGDGHPQWNHLWRPRDFADYGRFTGWLVRRYAPLGVHVFEVWNEPNFAHFWPSGPNPGEYAEMLRDASVAIRRADPAATVLLGGLYQNGAGFLDGVYRAGAGGSFDGVADHFYPPGDPGRCGPGRGGEPPESLCGIADVRRVMRAYGDGHKPVWITEFGWSTWDDGVSQAAQATYVAGAFRQLARDFPGVPVAIAYNLRDNYWLGDDSGSQEGNYGFLRTDFTPKPALGALTSAVTGRSAIQQLFGFVAGALALGRR